jgi:hypothetical protein
VPPNPAELENRLEQTASTLRSYAEATLMLSEQVSASLRNHREPDPGVAEKLRKAFALLTTAEDEASSLMKDHARDAIPATLPSMPINLAEEAEAKMKELVLEGFEK